MAKSVIKTFKAQVLDDALRDFAYQVKDKKYRKMPYNMWQKMMKIIKNYPDRQWWIEMENGDPIFVCDTGDYFRFECDDACFGEYWLHCYDPNGEYTMISKTEFSKVMENLQKAASNASTALKTAATTVSASLATSASSLNDYNYTTATYSPATTTTATITDWMDGNYATSIPSKVIEKKKTEISVKNGEYIKTKGENDMMNFNFDFGPCTNNFVKLSLYGIAVKNANDTYVAYDKATGKIMDVDILNFDGAKYLYKMPCAIQNVAVGDVIVHNHKPVIVTAVNGTVLTAVDIAVNEQKDIIPTRNMFNFDYVTKVVSLFDFMGGFKADANNPFGNMLPLILMNDSNNKDMLPMLFMMNGNTNFDFVKNPMMLYFLMGDKGSNSNDILPFMMLAAGGNFSPTTSPTEPKAEAALTLDENYISEVVNKTLDKWLDNGMNPTSPSDNA